MKKIKLVVSDLHLGTGKNVFADDVNLMEEFHYDDRFAEFINYYSVGEYANCEIELILNGDILNLIQVDYRGHHLAVLTESISLEKLKRIVAGHTVFFESLKKFAKNPNHSITYVIGNHDQEMLWPKTREYLNEVIEYNIRYRNIVYYFDGVHIEHGHMHDVANRLDPKKFFIRKNVPEPILHLPFGTYFFVEFVLKVKKYREHIDKVRPLKSYLRWGLLQDTWFTLKTIIRMYAFFIKSAFKKDSKNPFSLGFLLEVFREGKIFPDLNEAAQKVLKDERVHTVIFGHSHVYQFKQYESSKFYFNTGTWTEVTSLDMSSFGKITKLTYVLLEYEPESNKPRSRLKHWRGYHRIEEDMDLT